MGRSRLVFGGWLRGGRGVRPGLGADEANRCNARCLDLCRTRHPFRSHACVRTSAGRAGKAQFVTRSCSGPSQRSIRRAVSGIPTAAWPTTFHATLQGIILNRTKATQGKNRKNTKKTQGLQVYRIAGFYEAAGPGEPRHFRRQRREIRAQKKKRVAGIEPAWPAWKAGALPLSYTRVVPVACRRRMAYNRRPSTTMTRLSI